MDIGSALHLLIASTLKDGFSGAMCESHALLSNVKTQLLSKRSCTLVQTHLMAMASHDHSFSNENKVMTLSKRRGE